MRLKIYHVLVYFLTHIEKSVLNCEEKYIFLICTFLFLIINESTVTKLVSPE